MLCPVSWSRLFVIQILPRRQDREEDLAPNLAKQLGIGSTNSNDLWTRARPKKTPITLRVEVPVYCRICCLPRYKLTRTHRTPEPPTCSYQIAPIIIATQASAGRGDLHVHRCWNCRVVMGVTVRKCSKPKESVPRSEKRVALPVPGSWLFCFRNVEPWSKSKLQQKRHAPSTRPAKARRNNATSHTVSRRPIRQYRPLCKKGLHGSSKVWGI
jgi:hypothetical protein